MYTDTENTFRNYSLKTLLQTHPWDAKALFMECNETVMVNGSEMLQSLKAQS